MAYDWITRAAFYRAQHKIALERARASKLNDVAAGYMLCAATIRRTFALALAVQRGQQIGHHFHH